MPRHYMTKELKRLVSQRAKSLCEYCLISEQDSGGCQFDHIISVKHGGETSAENLAYACLYCNLNKGTDLGSIIWRTGDLVRFFNPRRDPWSEHFRLEGAMIQSLTDIGEVTAIILQFNSSDRLLERQLLIEVNRYPSPDALKQMKA
ncbi:HNH endonuclease [Moorena bouillonii]|uniref:HNH endonuclease n=1 Tax=Moorena bouillonii PNG TaxID=568701 RepID=A0A1U7N852_9CYAN|nr:HNH endonuclease [Moorena bouillonii]OLT62129.1 HNH endonuclease [Moorena bouillonii PNG]